MYRVLPFFLVALLVQAHGDHEQSPQSSNENLQYAQKHMASEHHIENFDLKSFFHLHDLNRDGMWTRDEIEAIYGVHHVYSQKKSKDDIEHQKKADHIVNTVLASMDKNNDGKVSPEEFEAAGLNALPSFDGLGAEGHHYDVESEFFLHHEEQFHSTPETQTDESYNHPEDIEHFAQHEAIERIEAEKEAKYQGIPVEEVLAQHDHDHAEPPPPAADKPKEQEKANVDADRLPAAEHETVPHPHDDSPTVPPVQAPPPVASGPKITRQTPPEKLAPSERYKGAQQEGAKRPEWGEGEAGYRPPSNPSDKMRKNVPYKERMQYKFRRNWGDF
ncbi:precursor to secretory protein Ssp120 [Rickenella mellea]|uniref:Precursor to secretory protein Ssp120 n=1 Tax=Rickenella mellea TaxID=50990 RepID=A0A4Y7QFK2_9AGAM|nr:precursor to secretory protein Ssp120 [Rickenella mellea]